MPTFKYLACPACGSHEIARIEYGYIDPVSMMHRDRDDPWMRAVHDGDIVLGGCDYDSKGLQCKACRHRW